MDSQYGEIAAKDRLAIGESFSTNAIPLYLTNYNEKIDMDSTDTKCKIVKFQFESPHNDADKYSFSMRVPELRDGKFLHLNGSDKVMIRQKLAKPIIKLTDSVAFTTYYNKMFIVSTNGNLNKRTSKIKKYMKYIRKNYSNLILGRYFDFTPGYFAHRQKNI
jgi:SUMO ligase MMS21 Smc5/6 complex component